jgi:Tfp pilus assembly PilM family ATPase
MNLHKLFIKKESIAGIEFTEDAVRLAFFELNDRNERVLTVLCEETLPPGTLRDGMVKDREKLTDALRALLLQSAVPIEYVVVSLPPDQVYIKKLSFPKNLPEEKLEEAVKLKIDFQMPQNQEAAYIDWEEVTSKEHREFFVASIGKAVVEEYSICLSHAGLKPIAIEFQPLSLLRTLDLPRERTAFIALTTREHLAVFIVHDKALLFMRIIPRTSIAGRTEEAELKEIADYYQSAFGPIEEAYDTPAKPQVMAVSHRVLIRRGKPPVYL